MEVREGDTYISVVFSHSMLCCIPLCRTHDPYIKAVYDLSALAVKRML